MYLVAMPFTSFEICDAISLFLVVYLLKKLGHLACQIPHISDVAFFHVIYKCLLDWVFPVKRQVGGRGDSV